MVNELSTVLSIVSHTDLVLYNYGTVDILWIKRRVRRWPFFYTELSPYRRMVWEWDEDMRPAVGYYQLKDELINQLKNSCVNIDDVPKIKINYTLKIKKNKISFIII